MSGLQGAMNRATDAHLANAYAHLRMALISCEARFRDMANAKANKSNVEYAAWASEQAQAGFDEVNSILETPEYFMDAPCLK